MRLLLASLLIAAACSEPRGAYTPHGGAAGSGGEAGGGCGPFCPPCDADGDGHLAPSCGGDDCDDRDPTIHPKHWDACGDFVDDDCDGEVDDSCSCLPGDLKACFPIRVDPWARDLGACRPGWQRCNEDGDGWGRCQDAIIPTEDLTCDGIDADCDGEVDEGLTNACGTCGALREVCFNGLDDDCDGRIDPPDLCDLRCDDIDAEADLPRLACCLLPPGSDLSGTPCERRDCDGRIDQPCYSGPPQTLGKGICHGGVASCTGGPGERAWTVCAGEQLPESEVCGDGIDNDCDGQVDEEDGETQQSCTIICCSPNAVELCGDGQDNDCDGLPDEACPATADQQVCTTAPGGSRNVGICRDGVQQRDGDFWGPCLGEVTSSTETCGDGLDSDCDGFGGPGAEEDAGCCVPDGREVCDGTDNDCDGLADEHVRSACGRCADEPCHDDELIGSDACTSGTCDGVVLTPFWTLQPASGAERAVFRRVVDAHHLTVRWKSLGTTFVGPGTVEISVRVAPTRRALADVGPCATGSGAEVSLETCNLRYGRFAEVTLSLVSSTAPARPEVASVRLIWTRP